MQKQLKQWILLSALVPTFAMAQALSNSSSPSTLQSGNPPVQIDAEKKGAIKALLEAIDARQLVNAIGNGAQMQSKQMVPGVLSEALRENKALTDPQKEAAVPALQKNAVPKLVDNAGKVFLTQPFMDDAIQAQYDAYAKYYSTQEIKELTQFYRSSTGRKFIEVQDQVGRDVVGHLMEKYMPQSIQATRDQANKEVAAVQPRKAGK